MHVSELPAPPPGKIGWPWTDESRADISGWEKKQAWTRLTIVTPSFNQAQYLEETIRSILLQDYPNLEYFVIDGGSTDGSVEIIKKYERYLTYWESGKDRGQSDALNRGFKRASGDWVGWINSDDLYLPGALQALMGEASSHQELEWVAGSVQFVRLSEPPVNEVRLQGQNRELIDWLLVRSEFHQPGAVWKRSLFDRFGYLNDGMQYAFDWEFWCRLSANGISPGTIERPVALFRMHESSKTSSSWDRFCAEDQRIVEMYIDQFKGADRRALEERLTSLVCTRIRHESRRLLPDGQHKELFRRVCSAACARPAILAKKTPYELLLSSAVGAAAKSVRRNHAGR
jgi:hypothetical protein